MLAFQRAVHPQSACDLGQPNQLRLVGVVVREMMRVSPQMDFMAWPAQIRHRPWVEKAVFIGDVVNLGAGVAANLALSLVVLRDHVAEQQPLVGV